jgi:uncharacterized protein DUF3455
MKALSLIVCTAAALIAPTLASAADVPDAIAASGQTLVLTVHAEGAQIYECKADQTGALVWEFREPVATLIADGKTIGRHYAGPNWELADGSIVAAKAAGRAPGATAKDIPLLKLDVTSQRGSGQLAGVTTIQRLNTKGGTAEKTCHSAGSFLSVAYSADYAFYRKGQARLAPEQK